ncbi:uncharacterized protein THITE_2092766 [Thermothielavioides terrestris NRRL 8126]|uniref:Uncharacterized protein n=1 Tax=Thermothielavioides terrestris (strain ATCC 38088 / NRRL 8126) TaxID=578455 RepID=G2RHE5_THETT|nr:uncharacterized protein THITE_2092766 [Thermothielavioides terrestris NRRL 8126]AEO71257.1 hypothetical protein THITE_2092766 [Thermothielavioides terrestris NRRL 8126]
MPRAQPKPKPPTPPPPALAKPPATPNPIPTSLRTRYCIPGSVFLVEAIDRCVPVPAASSSSSSSSSSAATSLPAAGRSRGGSSSRRRSTTTSRYRAVRLLLGDGELCIQAFVRPEMHCFVDRGSVWEGCYVRVDRFELGFVEEEGKGKVVYLVVGDLVTVGWNEEYLAILNREREAKGPGEPEGEKGVGDQRESGAPEGKEEEEEDVEDLEEVLQQLVADAESGETAAPALHDDGTAHPVADSKSPAPKPPIKEEAPEPETDYISDSEDSAFETLQVSPSRIQQRRIAVAAPDPRQEFQTAIIQQNQHQHQHQHQHHEAHHHPPPVPNNPLPRPRPWQPTTPLQPHKLTPLSAIPHLPYRQNWMVNVLAVVTALAPAEPSHIAPSYRQRTARLADPSTPKRVLLSVLLDPDAFAPAVGSVVLLLGVKNHVADGGSLRKYVSDRPRGGHRWWVERPEGLGWCCEEAERLRLWWEGRGGKVDEVGDG